MWPPINMPGVIYRDRTARQDYECWAKVGCVIKRGDRYMEVVIAPWTQVVDDADDEGHPISHPAGNWHSERFHVACADDLMYGPI